LSLRNDGGFAAATSSIFNPYGGREPISFDFNVASVFSKPHFRDSPRISPINPPIQLPFDVSSTNGLIVGAGLVGAAVLVYMLGKRQKWWK